MEMYGWKLGVLDMLNLKYIINTQGESGVRGPVKLWDTFNYMSHKYSNSI